VADTHEHLVEESVRIAAGNFDFARLLDNYPSHDLSSAGMPLTDWERCSLAIGLAGLAAARRRRSLH
jgi:hypothetical protein